MARTSSTDIPVSIQLERENRTSPITDQIATQIRTAVLDGRLRNGDPLPSIRKLSQQLKVARATIEAAYFQLAAEGYLETRTGSGTRIAAKIPDKVLSIVQPQNKTRKSKRSLRNLPLHAQRLADISHPILQHPRPLAVISPSPELSPGKIWSRIAARLAKTPWKHSEYADPQGHKPLREAIADYVRRMRAVRCTPEQIVITAGTQQALMLCSRVLFSAGDTVWIENPCYPALSALLQFSNLRTLPISVDNQGLVVKEGIARASNAKGAFVTPSHQYPLGMSMPVERRLALLQWAQQKGSWLIEDDYDSELRYAGRPLPALQGLDASGETVIYLGTFSKMLFPGLRLGYLIAPIGIVAAFSGARFLIDRHSPGMPQALLAEFIVGGHYDAHVRRIRSLLMKRREILIQACQSRLTDFGKLISSDQGMHIVLEFHHNIDDTSVVTHLKKQGIETAALSPFYFGRVEKHGLVLGFSGFEPAAILSAIKIIETTLRKIQRHS